MWSRAAAVPSASTGAVDGDRVYLVTGSARGLGRATADVLVADASEWFVGHGGLSRENGDRLRASILSRGDSRDAIAMFREFTGGEPDVAPLVRRRARSGRPVWSARASLPSGLPWAPDCS